MSSCYGRPSFCFHGRDVSFAGLYEYETVHVQAIAQAVSSVYKGTWRVMCLCGTRSCACVHCCSKLLRLAVAPDELCALLLMCGGCDYMPPIQDYQLSKGGLPTLLKKLKPQYVPPVSTVCDC